MKIFDKIDYKGKYFIIQDKEVFEDNGMEFRDGEISEDEITEYFLQEHVTNCLYYGIPPYIGTHKPLRKRMDDMYDKLAKIKQELKELE